MAIAAIAIFRGRDGWHSRVYKYTYARQASLSRLTKLTSILSLMSTTIKQQKQSFFLRDQSYLTSEAVPWEDSIVVHLSPSNLFEDEVRRSSAFSSHMCFVSFVVAPLTFSPQVVFSGQLKGMQDILGGLGDLRISQYYNTKYACYNPEDMTMMVCVCMCVCVCVCVCIHAVCG